jgi:hypothetical protein
MGKSVTRRFQSLVAVNPVLQESEEGTNMVSGHIAAPVRSGHFELKTCQLTLRSDLSVPLYLYLDRFSRLSYGM